jgi:selenium-binding protein 1
VPPLVTDINLSVDDKFLYVSCWGIGELKQYDVSDPASPREVGSVRRGGITGRVAHPAAPGEAPAGGPQMVEVSRDGKRIYLTNSLYGSWDDQFYPDGVGSWFAKIDTDPAGGGGCTRSGWAAATRPRTPTATRRDNGSPGRPRPG